MSEPEAIPSREFIPMRRGSEEGVVFFEQHTGYAHWRGLWWVQLDGYWFQVRNEAMCATLQARWVHLHALREHAKRSTADSKRTS